MPHLPSYPTLLSHLTLGTARHPLAPAIIPWLDEREATDPTADDAERLLAAVAFAERLHRLEPAVQPDMAPAPAPEKGNAAAPDEDRQPASPRLTRALELIFGGTYPALLPEAVAALNEQYLLLPPRFLPEALAEALRLLPADPDLASQLLAAGGHRAPWLAARHPDWRELTPDFDLATAFRTDATPGRRGDLLRRWRRQDPAAAREALAAVWAEQSPKNQEVLLEGMHPGLSAADIPWLRAQLAPKRRGVRRQLARLLLAAGDDTTRADFHQLLDAMLDERGNFRHLLAGNEAQELLKQYGSLRKNESLTAFALRHLPPDELLARTGKTPTELWAGLAQPELTAAAEAIVFYGADELAATFVRYALRNPSGKLPSAVVAELVADLDQATFLTIYHELLDREQNVLHHGSLARVAALGRREHWSERITKAFLLQLTATLRDVQRLGYQHQRAVSDQWRLAIPLLDPGVFGWARTHLHSVADRGDVFGKLATETLQTLAFRRVFWE